MIAVKIFGALLMLSFIALLHGLGTTATELPVGEGQEEELHESSANDPIRYDVLSDLHKKPVELKQV